MQIRADIEPRGVHLVSTHGDESPKPAGTLLYVDGIRCTAILMVVLLHVASAPLKAFQYVPLGAWWVSNIVDSFTRPCVPLFVMLSGLLLLNPSKQESISDFFRKRMKRVLIPFFAWAGVYFVWRVVAFHEEIGLRQGLRELVQGPVYYHLWFIYMLVGLYLVVPILRAYTRQASRQNLIYFVALWFAAASILPATQHIFHYYVGLDIVVATHYVGYFVAGHLLRDVKLNGKQVWMVLALMAGLALSAAVITYIVTSRGDGTLFTGLADYLSPNVVILSFCQFLLLRRIPYARLRLRMPGLYRAIVTISATSFSVYLLHIMILETFTNGWLGFELTAMTAQPFVGIPLTTAVTMLISIPVVLAMRRVPALKAVFQ